MGTLFVFGSVLGSQFNEASDIDFVVDFKDVDLYDYADNYFNLKGGLAPLFCSFWLNTKINVLQA